MEGRTIVQVLHGWATTTTAIRRAIQHNQESLRILAKRYGINQKTVAKWRKRASFFDLPTGPKHAKSTVLPIEDEAVVVAFRRHTLLPLDGRTRGRDEANSDAAVRDRFGGHGRSRQQLARRNSNRRPSEALAVLSARQSIVAAFSCSALWRSSTALIKAIDEYCL
jgi:transposase-like protein